MSSSVEKPSGTQSLLTGQNVVYAGIAWAILSLLFFLLFSIGEERPLWYSIGTYVLELFPFIAAALLCYRNWLSQNIASGRNVWLGIGLGMLCYFIGGLIFFVWELYWGLNAEASPADLLYLICYGFVGWGMVLAVLPRRLNLEPWQWGTVAGIAIAGIACAVLLSLATINVSDKAEAAAKAAATELLAVDAASSPGSASPTAPKLKASKTKDATASAANESDHKNAPDWAISLAEFVKPLAKGINLTYITFDVLLLIIASTLLLAFWGGRFAQSWRMIAAATFCFYIADMSAKYAFATELEYLSGGLLEVFYVFSGVLFAIGAALEYEISSRSRRSPRKRA